jgi:hypothetical protein
VARGGKDNVTIVKEGRKVQEEGEGENFRLNLAFFSFSTLRSLIDVVVTIVVESITMK